MATFAPARATQRPTLTADGLIGQALTGLAVAACAAGVTYLATSRTTVLGVAALVVIVGTLWFAATRHTPLALAVLMLYLGVLDGYLKLASGSNLVTFVRDILLYGIVAGQLIRAVARGTRLERPPLSGWILTFVVLVVVQLFNPADGSLSHSLAGIRQHLEFIPLFFLTYAFVRTTRALRVFVILLLVIAAANSAVNWVQFHMTPQQLAGWGPGYSERINGQGGFVGGGRTFNDTSNVTHTRPFGLGSDAGSGGLAAAFSVGAILALASRFRRARYLLLAIAMATIVAVGVVTSEGRAAIIVSLVVAVGYGLLAAGSRGRLTTLLGAVLALGLAGVVVDVVLTSAGSSAFRYQGLSTSGIFQTTQQSRGKSFAAIPYNLTHYPLGVGLGVGGPAAGQAGAPPAAQTAGIAGSPSAVGVDTETEISFATLETGIPGMVTIIGFTALLFGLGVRRCRHERDPETRVLLAAIIAPAAGMLALYTVAAATPTTPTGPYLWACGGIVSYWLVTRPAARRSAHGRAEPNAAIASR